MATRFTEFLALVMERASPFPKYNSQEVQNELILAVHAGSENLTTAENADTADMVPGQPVYVSAAGRIKLADASIHPEVLGLANETILQTIAGEVITDGIKTMLESQWDSITGESGGLTAGAVYYLGLTPGTLTKVAPASGHVVRLGKATSNVDFEISITQPVRL